MPTNEPIAGRTYALAYRVSGRSDLRDLLLAAVEASGGRVVTATAPTRAPVYIGVELDDGERLGIVAYPFRCSGEPIRGRAEDEHRFQIRYGSEQSWVGEEHPVGRDPGAVDVTTVLGVHPARDVIIGLDPLAYDPLPMGISFEFKEADVAVIERDGWYALSRSAKRDRASWPRAQPSRA